MTALYEIQSLRRDRWRRIGSSDLELAAIAAATAKATPGTRVRVVEIETGVVVSEIHGGTE